MPKFRNDKQTHMFHFNFLVEKFISQPDFGFSTLLQTTLLTSSVLYVAVWHLHRFRIDTLKVISSYCEIMRSSVVLIAAIIVMTCVVTSSAADGQCSRQVTRTRNECSEQYQSYTSYRASFCPFRKIYYSKGSTSYRLVTSCSPVEYVDTEYYCCPGYRSVDSTCVDIDECAEGTDECQNDSVCANTDGSYICECYPGFNGTHCEHIKEV